MHRDGVEKTFVFRDLKYARFHLLVLTVICHSAYFLNIIVLLFS